MTRSVLVIALPETSLHLTLKSLYTTTGARQEAMVDGYQIDVVDGDLLIEIQTRSFTTIKPKLLARPRRRAAPRSSSRASSRRPTNSLPYLLASCGESSSK